MDGYGYCCTCGTKREKCEDCGDEYCPQCDGDNHYPGHHAEDQRLRFVRSVEVDAKHYRQPNPLEQLAAVTRERDAAIDLLKEVAASGVEFSDPRISYVVMQIDKETLRRIRKITCGVYTPKGPDDE
jgi:hypothetical protein